MVSVLTFMPLLPLLHNVSEFEALILDCVWCSFIFLSALVCLLLNLGNGPITELIILEEVLGLLTDATKNLWLLGSATYNCFKATSCQVVNFTIIRHCEWYFITDNDSTELKRFI